MYPIVSICDLFQEKTNIVDSALSINQEEPKHAMQVNPGRYFLPPVDFLFQESLIYTPEMRCVGLD